MRFQKLYRAIVWHAELHRLYVRVQLLHRIYVLKDIVVVIQLRRAADWAGAAFLWFGWESRTVLSNRG